ncbi:hypothetical protein GWK47_047688 [Chionoecetes opilio]|uniref:Uncharacterized protein n=1 Tax=Chionoecetes opilio TaxID=41210 RepID=A0A8J5CU95_CHIOP|nr:hypothetical protein GWK47_047688 [Chionoecetes opilio]
MGRAESNANRAVEGALPVYCVFLEIDVVDGKVNEKALLEAARDEHSISPSSAEHRSGKRCLEAEKGGLLANLFHELDHGAIFWLLLSGGHCLQLVDDMNAPAALMVHHVGSQDVEVGRKLDFPLRIRSIVDRLNDSIGTPVVLTRASSTGNGPRSTEDCERRWYNVLQKSKTHIARYKKEQKQTGGGPCTTSLTAIDELVYDIVGRNSTVFVGVKEPYAFESCLGQLRKPDAYAPLTASSAGWDTSELLLNCGCSACSTTSVAHTFCCCNITLRCTLTFCCFTNYRCYTT